MKAEASNIATSVKGAKAAHAKGWLDVDRKPDPYWSQRERATAVYVPEFKITTRGREILAQARTLGWKPKQGALDL